MYRHNLLRMLGSVIWVAIPILSLTLLLPHNFSINYGITLLLLLCMLLLNFATLLLPTRESILTERLGLLTGAYGVAMIGLTCAAIHFSGGVRSPYFAFLLLVTAFCTSLYTSLKSAVIISGFSAGAYLAVLLLFSPVSRHDTQLLCAQIFFLFLVTFFINRLGAESREQLREKEKALQELRALSEMDRAASSFVSAVSFEMRTPLTSILGFSEMLANKSVEPEKEQEYVNIISREADNLSRLVEDLLDISRLESGRVKLNREVTKLEVLFKGSIPLLQPVCDPSRMVMNIPPDLPDIMVDIQRMKRVFDAVCGYIARKSARGSEIRISAKTEGQEVVLTLNIRNRAVASPPEEEERLFPPPTSHDDEGLELAMARRIIMAHMGSINLIQASGGWFTIVIRLPLITPYDLAGKVPATLGGMGGRPA